ncbi:MAG: hypothetical protein JWO60_514 [Frankiales bacterium]|nr:hypothetical protein [Frankiales bacterium]
MTLPLSVRALRVVAALEGVSFLLLLVFGSLLSRVSEVDLVGPLGMLHGALFTALVVLVLASLPWLRWSAPWTLLVVTVLSPVAHFAVQATVERRRSRHAA